MVQALGHALDRRWTSAETHFQCGMVIGLSSQVLLGVLGADGDILDNILLRPLRACRFARALYSRAGLEIVVLKHC